MRERLRWLVMHGFVRGVSALAARAGDPQARLISDPGAKADPFPIYEEIRSHGPMVRGRAAVVTVDHRAAHEILRSDKFRSGPIGANLPGPLGWVELHTRTDLLHPLLPPSLLAVEPPEHTRYRKTVSAVFTPRAVGALRERVETTANSLLDELSGAGSVDIVDRYCSRLPIAVIGDILGVPESDRPMIFEFGELAAPSLDIGLSWSQYRRVHEGLVKFEGWLTEHLRQLRRNPGDDLMSQLIGTAQDGEYLDDAELRATAGLVLAAGFETTVNLLGNGIRILLDAPDTLRLLRERPQLWPSAVEEILRMESPVQLTARVAREDAEVCGTSIAAGELVVCYLAGANRDPAVFERPDELDVERENANRHLSFSGGRHFCLGAALARAEGEVGLRAFFDRFPNARAAGAGVRRDTRVLRGWASLPVELDPGVGRRREGMAASAPR